MEEKTNLRSESSEKMRINVTFLLFVFLALFPLALPPLICCKHSLFLSKGCCNCVDTRNVYLLKPMTMLIRIDLNDNASSFHSIFTIASIEFPLTIKITNYHPRVQYRIIILMSEKEISGALRRKKMKDVL
jgi:hypothetical protein